MHSELLGFRTQPEPSLEATTTDRHAKVQYGKTNALPYHPHMILTLAGLSAFAKPRGPNTLAPFCLHFLPTSFSMFLHRVVKERLRTQGLGVAFCQIFYT